MNHLSIQASTDFGVISHNHPTLELDNHTYTNCFDANFRPIIYTRRQFNLFFWLPVSIPCPNYEVVGFQHQAVDIPNLGSVHPFITFSSPPISKMYANDKTIKNKGHQQCTVSPFQHEFPEQNYFPIVTVLTAVDTNNVNAYLLKFSQGLWFGN